MVKVLQIHYTNLNTVFSNQMFYSVANSTAISQPRQYYLLINSNLLLSSMGMIRQA